MHRLIMTSTVYRQSSLRDPAKDAIDSENRLLGRYPVRRLDAESLRDRSSRSAAGSTGRLYGPVGRRGRGRRRPGVAGGRLAAAERLPSGAADPPGLVPVGFRRAGDERQLRAADAQHVGPAVAHAHEQRLRPEPRRRRSPGGSRPRRPATSDDDLRAGRWSGGSAYAWRLIYQRPISRRGDGPGAIAFAAEQRAALDREDAKGDRDQAVLTNLCQQLLNSNEFLYVD